MTTIATNLPGASYDNKIACKFAKKNINNKNKCRQALLDEYGLICGKKDLVIGIVGELSKKNNAELFLQIVEGLMSLQSCLIVRAKGSALFQKELSNLHQQYPQHIALAADNDTTLRQTLAGSDVIFIFGRSAEEQGLALAALKYAALPIVPESFSHLVEPYNPNQESGNGWLYQDDDPWSAFTAVVRASENFRFPYDWKALQQSAISG